MGSDWLPRGFDEISPEDLERSMEHEVEGLMELDDLELVPTTAEQITADLLRGGRAGSPAVPNRPAAQSAGARRQGGR